MNRLQKLEQGSGRTKRSNQAAWPQSLLSLTLRISTQGLWSVWVLSGPKGNLVPVKQLLCIPSSPSSGNHQSSLTLWIYLFWIFHVNGIIQYGTFWIFFHLACFQDSSTLWPGSYQCVIHLCAVLFSTIHVYTTICLSIHPPMDIWLVSALLL